MIALLFQINTLAPIILVAQRLWGTSGSLKSFSWAEIVKIVNNSPRFWGLGAKCNNYESMMLHIGQAWKRSSPNQRHIPNPIPQTTPPRQLHHHQSVSKKFENHTLKERIWFAECGCLGLYLDNHVLFVCLVYIFLNRFWTYGRGGDLSTEWWPRFDGDHIWARVI